MWRRTSENVPVSFVSRVDFPTDGNPDILTLCSETSVYAMVLPTRPILASPTFCTSNPAVSRCYSCPSGQFLRYITFTFPTSTATGRRLDQFTAQFRKLCLRAHVRSHYHTSMRLSTFSSPKCPAVALFFCVRAICRERSITAL